MADTILSLDPSSTCTGWAVLKTGEVYVASGRIMPALVHGVPKGHEPYQRIGAICQGVRDLLSCYPVTIIVMEWTSGKRAARLGKNVSHLAIYGAAVGAIWREAINWTTASVVGVLENEWTRNRPKRERILTARAMFPQYNPDSDSGGDEADALMLNTWYQRERKVRGL